MFTFYAQDIVGINSSSIPVNIIIGFSATGDMYAASFPTFNFIAEGLTAVVWQS